MAQITRSALLDPQTGQKLLSSDGTLLLVPAVGFDKNVHKGAICVCPDENCKAELVLYRQHQSTFYNEDKTASFTLTVPAHFKSKARNAHHENCAVLKGLIENQNRIVSMGGKHVEEGMIVFNDNIPSDNHVKVPRQGRRLSPEFFAAAHNQGEREGASLKKLSEGINHASKLAEILRQNFFDKNWLQSTIIRRNGKLQTLEDYFQDDMVDFARKLYGRSIKLNIHFERSAAIVFEPIRVPNNGKIVFHNPHARTILGQFKISEKDKRTKVAVLVHADNDETYKAFKAAIRSGAREFLVASQRCYVDVQDTAEKMKRRGQSGQVVYIHAHIGNSAQFCKWESPSLFPGLAIVPKPPRPQTFLTNGGNQQTLDL